MKKNKSIDLNKVVEIYEKKGCNVSATCAALGIERRTFYNWKNSEPSFAEAIADADESIIDFCESKLIEQINNGNLTAIIFMLKTKGKKRGYIETVENQLTLNPFEELMKSLPDE